MVRGVFWLPLECDCFILNTTTGFKRVYTIKSFFFFQLTCPGYMSHESRKNVLKLFLGLMFLHHKNLAFEKWYVDLLYPLSNSQSLVWCFAQVTSSGFVTVLDSSRHTGPAPTGLHGLTLWLMSPVLLFVCAGAHLCMCVITSEFVH